MFFVRYVSDKQISTDRGLQNDCLIEDIVVVIAVAVGEAKIEIIDAFFDKRN